MQNTKSSWFPIDVEAGLELWQGGAGLKTNSFAVDLDGSAPASSPASAPTPVATGASPGSATSRAGTCSATYSGANTAPSSVSCG